MKRFSFFLTFIVLVGALILSACGANTPAPTTVINSSSVTAPATITETKAAETQASTPTTGSPQATSTQPSTLPQTDDEWRAFITEKLQGHHSLDFLLGQNLTEQQWRDVLAKQMHADVILTAEEETAMIQWLMAH